MKSRSINQISEPERGKEQISLIGLYALTVFLGAFLLFQVQPLIGKYILPWFGGGPEVWTTCMLLFQVLLLAGYAYAHFSISRLGAKTQAILHIVLIAAALATLPITPSDTWKPQSLDHPVWQILLVVAACIGLPYFVLASTSTLLQCWAVRINKNKSPYRLYAVSNLGSLIALVSYPFIVEPALSRKAQTYVWSAAWIVFGILCACCAVLAQKYRDTKQQYDDEQTGPSCRRRALWLLLAMGASVELLAVTNKICQDIVVIPFLWILPLTLYLLSFVICFAGEKWYIRRVFLVTFIVSIIGAVFARVYEQSLSVGQQILLYSALLFSCCMVCHGELFRLRPGRRNLANYYLMIATGGALGGFFVAVIAPLIFQTYIELYLGILACCLFVLLTDESLASKHGARRWGWAAVIMIVGGGAILFQGQRGAAGRKAVDNTRNFFGVLTIWEKDRDNPSSYQYLMQHGTTFHGLQFVDPTKRSEPTAYYGRNSGVGLAIKYFPRQEQRRIGVLGLGVGTVAAYCKQEDYIRFYEINPEVERLAEKWFTYLSDCAGEVEVVVGDGRLSMEAETEQQFDLLAIDAFTGDAIPVHLLTREAFEIYLRHIKKDGVLAIHVSTVHLDLQSVIWKLAEDFGLKNVWIQSAENKQRGVFSSDWILLTNNEKFLAAKEIRAAASEPADKFRDVKLWTDDYVNLFEILK